jgi:hypothetical protein
MTRMRHDLCDLWWVNDFMWCLWIMKEICVESMIIENKERLFYSMKHEHGCEWESA